MSLVTLKENFQVLIPASVRRKIRVEVGDLLEAKAHRGKITFIPTSAKDKQDPKHKRLVMKILKSQGITREQLRQMKGNK